MGIGAADAERRHAHPARLFTLWPRDRLGEQPYVTLGPIHVGGRLVNVQRGGQEPASHRHHHLDHTGYARGGLGVADVGLDGAEPQGTVVRPVLSVRGQQRLGLDRVAERRTGAVRLDRVHLGRRQAGVGECLPDDPLLGGSVRRGQAVAGAVLVDR